MAALELQLPEALLSKPREENAAINVGSGEAESVLFVVQLINSWVLCIVFACASHF